MLFEKIQTRLNHYLLNHYLLKTSGLDGRFLLLGILILYFLPILFTSNFFLNYPQEWESSWIYPLVPKLLPPFADMRVVTSGAECIRLGYDVLIANPCDPWNRPMNYPRIWSIPAYWGLDQSHTIPLSICFGLLFFISTFLIINRLNNLEVLVYSLILCSPSVMLAVERGNIDLIIFVLLAMSLLMMRSKSLIFRNLAYTIILFSSVLKLYPIFTLISCLKEKRKDFKFIFVSIMTTFGIYIITHFRDIKLISNATPRAVDYSYGGKVIFDASTRTSNPIFILILFFLTLLAISYLFYFLVIKGKYIYKSQELNIEQIDSFRVGASIYIGTFLIGNNWDYRLIFLVFTIPQILNWIKSFKQLSLPSIWAIIAIILTTWLSSKSAMFYRLDEIINWLLFIFFVYSLIITLPSWLKDYILLKYKYIHNNN